MLDVIVGGGNGIVKGAAASFQFYWQRPANTYWQST